MRQLSYKYKIIIVVVAFVVFAVGMQMYGYGILENRNRVLAEAASKRVLELETLKTEQLSFEQGQKDLASLAEKDVPPSELFSKDTKVFKEIQRLEAVAARSGVKFSLTIAGDAKTAPKAEDVASEIYIVPYTMTVDGGFEGVMKFTQELEHLPFITHVKMLSINVLSSGSMRGIYNSEFYIQR